MFIKTLILLSTLICSTLAAPSPAPAAAATINLRDTQWTITNMKRDCGLLSKCNYSFVIHDDTGAHQCTISSEGYYFSSWGPSLCAENYGGLVNISWSYQIGLGTLKVVFGPIPGLSPPVSDYATFKYPFPNLATSFANQTSTVYQTS